MESSKSLPTSKDFPVPYVLQEALGVYSISINERKLTIKYKKNPDFKGDISFILTGDLESTDRNEIGLRAIKKGFTTENAELLKTQMCLVLGSSPEAIDIIAEIKAQQKKVDNQKFEYSLSQKAATKKEGENLESSAAATSVEDSVSQTMKYTVKRSRDGGGDLSQLWETVKVGGHYHLVSYDSATDKLRFTTELPIEDENNLTLVPYTEKATDPYSFVSLEEFQDILQKARRETLGTLFAKVHKCVETFYDTDNEAHTNLIAADICFTYFQDKIGKTHYIFMHGKPGTGKGSVLELFNQVSYRGVTITNANAPNLYRLIGDLEKGQVVIIIDEANGLENDPFLQEVLKTGYKGNTRVARMLDASSAAHSKQRYYYTYCFKIIAANKLPAEWKAEGLLDRCFLIKTTPGNPLLDISDVVEHADDPKNLKIFEQLQYLRKLLFCYRLLHYSEPIPDIRLKGIVGRDAELIKPVIRLFRTHGKDAKVEKVVNKTLHHFVKQRTEDKSDTFDAFVHRELVELIENRDSILTEEGKKSQEIVEGIRNISFSDMWELFIKTKLDGSDIEGEPNSLQTSLYGNISKKRFAATLRALGGDKTRDSTGDKREWKFNTKTLERFTRAFKSIPDTIEVEEQHTLESAVEQTAIDFIRDDNYVENEDSIHESDKSDTSDTCIEHSREPENILSSENRKEMVGNDGEIEGKGRVNEDNPDAKNYLEGGEVSNDVSDVSDLTESSNQTTYSEASEEE